MSQKTQDIQFNVLSNYKPNTLTINSAFVPFEINLIDSYLIYSINTCCSICLSKIKEPYKVKPCGHIYCRRCISKWLKYRKTCPFCRRKIRF